MSQQRYSRYFPIIFLLADLSCLNLSFLFASYYRFNSFELSQEYQFLGVFVNLTWLFVFLSSRLQEINRNSSLLDHLNRVLTGLVINLSIVFALWFALQPVEFSRKFLFITYLTFTITILGWRSIWHYLIRYYRAKGYNYRNVLIIGEHDLSQSLVGYIKENPYLGYRVIATITNRELDELEDIIKDREADILFCCLPNLTDVEIRSIIHCAESNLVKVNLFSQFSKLMSYNLSIQQLGNIPIINVNAIPLDKVINRFIKRTFDIIFSVIVFITILSWLIPIVAVLIKLESKGPVFFKQNRHGRDNRFFEIYKFRSMYLHDDDDVKQATKSDSRITNIGAILRKTSIDELPQFINVLNGEMSVVGPRPHAVQHNIEYQPRIDRFWQRHAVKPGITGLAQAKGFRGETAAFSEMSGRVKLDRFYVKNWSLILDFKIILLTIISILRGNENAY